MIIFKLNQFIWKDITLSNIYVLSTVGMLHTGCQFGSGRLGSHPVQLNNMGTFDGTTDTQSDVKEKLGKEDLHVHLYVHGIGKNRGGNNQFSLLQNYEVEYFAKRNKRLIQITPEFRSKDNHDFSCLIEDQAEGIYKEYVRKLTAKLCEVCNCTEANGRSILSRLPLVITGHS